MGGKGMMGRNYRDRFIALATVSYEFAIDSLALLTKLNFISALPKAQTVKRIEFNHGISPRVRIAFLSN